MKPFIHSFALTSMSLGDLSLLYHCIKGDFFKLESVLLEFLTLSGCML